MRFNSLGEAFNSLARFTENFTDDKRLSVSVIVRDDRRGLKDDLGWSVHLKFSKSFPIEDGQKYPGTDFPLNFSKKSVKLNVLDAHRFRRWHIFDCEGFVFEPNANVGKSDRWSIRHVTSEQAIDTIRKIFADNSTTVVVSERE